MARKTPPNYGRVGICEPGQHRCAERLTRPGFPRAFACPIHRADTPEVAGRYERTAEFLRSLRPAWRCLGMGFGFRHRHGDGRRPRRYRPRTATVLRLGCTRRQRHQRLSHLHALRIPKQFESVLHGPQPRFPLRKELMKIVLTLVLILMQTAATAAPACCSTNLAAAAPLSD